MSSAFITEDFDASQWVNIEPYANDLLSRELNCSGCLETLIKDGSTLAEHVSEAGTLLSIAMTCDTESEAKRQSYLDFIENVQPKLSEFADAFNRRLAGHPAVDELPPRHDLMIKQIRTDIAIFREENIPLQVEEAKLETEHSTITGAMTVEFDGEERTFPQMALYFEKTDRSIREAAWRAVVERMGQDSERLSEIYDELIRIRHQIALNAGFDDYRPYIFEAKHRYDYSIGDCLEFHDSIERVCVPLMRELQERRRETLGVETLRPWDVGEKSGGGVDIHGRPPLAPFEDVERLISGCSNVFHGMSPELGGMFDMLRERDSLDLESRKGKAPGGYQANLEKTRIPFIFMNAAGTHDNLSTMLHEAGHAFHSCYSSNLELIGERNPPIEFAEVASMSMELMSQSQWDEFYDDEDARRAKLEDLEKIVCFLPWMATIDAFQHWVYANPEHTHEERSEYWLELRRKFGPRTDWSGFEVLKEISWQSQLHLFQVPFYYIEYGIAQLGALQLWQHHRRDAADGLIRYARAMKLGNTKSLPELFEAAGLDLGFGEGHVASLIGELRVAMVEIGA
ncbi:MAG: M3 family oligoendopeptidase [Candidatus Thalassarchaeum sp.]|nr:M3 family oligoendopeptidase [Candidatus Thalassarchaeum sp.]MDP6920790.1 M3 family oligoendopeptidase [Candidatus Thalassarchaeum sp.]MEE2606880.1 M3 family oligoendopeptidase [Candidatus Thermoplasmatota archaeon]